MKQWLRRFFLSLAVLLLILQVALVLASCRWINLQLVYSFDHHEHLSISAYRDSWAINRFRNTLDGIAYEGSIGPIGIGRPYDCWQNSYSLPPLQWRHLAVPTFRRNTITRRGSHWFLMIPTTYTILLNLLPILFYTRSVLRKRRSARLRGFDVPTKELLNPEP